MYTSMLQSRQLIVTVALFSIACVIEWFSIFTNVFHGDGVFWYDFCMAALPWIGGGLFVATSLSSFSFYQYIKLRKMVEELKSPEE